MCIRVYVLNSRSVVDEWCRPVHMMGSQMTMGMGTYRTYHTRYMDMRIYPYMYMIM